MNEQTLKGDWMILKGKIQEQWGRLTDDDLDVIEGKREQLAGAISKRYGYAKEEVEQQIREFNERVAHGSRI
ncbi:MAG: CsbD family protein [Planctomycetaceae bacterium]|nr:CsbD family protein [Planctomycetaceae bacterium]